MSWFESVSLKKPTADWPKSGFGAEQATLAQMGAMSPLWMLFVGASTMGMAYWGMTHWMRLATPGRAPGAVVKLRLVKPEPVTVTVAVEPVIPEAIPVPETVKAAAPVVPVIEPAPVVEAKAAPKPKPAPEPEPQSKPVAKAAAAKVVKAPAKAAPAAPAPKPAVAKAPTTKAVAEPAAKVEAAASPKAKRAVKTPRAKKS